MVYFTLLFLIFPSSTRVPFVVDVESKSVTLSARPVQGDTITAVFEVIPKETKEDLKVIFFGFEGTRPTTTDTVFPYDAQEGEKSTFSVDIVYLSTPALFKAKIVNARGRANGLGVYRYLMDVKTREYGTRREIQIKRPIEYRFNTGKRRFEREIFRFEKDRWAKNRAIIDSVQKLDDTIPDSLALVLYAEIPKALYPKGVSSTQERAQYLLQEGWSGELSESERNKLFEGLARRRLEEKERLAREKERQRNREGFSRSLPWLLSVAGLLVVLVLLFLLRQRSSLKPVTPIGLDRILKYMIYLFVIGAVVYFAYPYLPLHKKFRRNERLRKVGSIERENWAAVEDILRLDELKRYHAYPLVHKSPVQTKHGVGAHLTYKDEIHSNLNIEYRFKVKVYPTKKGTLRIIDAAYDLEKIIGNIERCDQFAAFVSKLHVEEVNLERRGEELLVTICDTIVKGSEQYPVRLQFDNKRGIITNYSVPAYFADPLFPELDTLRKRCRDAGYPVRHDRCIRFKYRGPKKSRGYAALVGRGGADTLWMWFSPDRPEDMGYRWIPVPRGAYTPTEIIEQLYYEFEKAGLPRAYARDHLEVISSAGKREPDYFRGTGDKVILEAKIKWHTGYEWIDECNKGEGVRFVVSYEYFAEKNELGKIVGRPNRLGKGQGRSTTGKRFFLKPLTRLISEDEARQKLFSKLPEDRAFSSIYIEVRIPEEKGKLKDFIFLVGIYSVRPGADGSIRVNLETGEVVYGGIVAIFS
jgi:hypothetical protein